MISTLERHRNILDFALSSLLRRKLKNFSLFAVYTLIVFVLASLVFFVRSLKHEASLLLQDAPDMVVQRLSAGRHDPIPTAYGARIAAIRGVAEVVPRQWGYYYDPAFAANYTLMVPDRRQIPPGSVVIGSGVARHQRIKAGDLLTLHTYRRLPLLLQVEQILPADSELVAADLMLLSSHDFQEMFATPQGLATDLAVTVSNPRELHTIAAKIVDQFPDTRPILKGEMLRTYQAVFDWRGGLLVAVLGVAVLSFVIFAWDKATGLSAEERREIGILKSIGWETGDILLLKFWEGTVISLSAFLCGALLAYGHVFFCSAVLFGPVLKGWSVLYPQFRLAPVVDGYQLSMLFCLSVLPYTAATIIPAWWAATIDPDAAMRS